MMMVVFLVAVMMILKILLVEQEQMLNSSPIQPERDQNQMQDNITKMTIRYKETAIPFFCVHFCIINHATSRLLFLLVLINTILFQIVNISTCDLMQNATGIKSRLARKLSPTESKVAQGLNGNSKRKNVVVDGNNSSSGCTRSKGGEFNESSSLALNVIKG